MKQQPAGQPPTASSDVLPAPRSREQVARSYDRISRIYHHVAGPFEGRSIEAGLELLQVRPGERVLEVGFGPGHALGRLARSAGPRGLACGVDLSPGMARVARRRLAEVPEMPGLALADAVHLPFRREAFHAVFISFTLEVLPPPEIPLVLDGVKRVLKPGGRLVVVGLSRRGGSMALRAYEWAQRRWPGLIDCRPFEVEQALAGAGFEVKERQAKSVSSLPAEVVLAISQPAKEPGIDTMTALKALVSWVTGGQMPDLQMPGGGSPLVIQPPDLRAPPPHRTSG